MSTYNIFPKKIEEKEKVKPKSTDISRFKSDTV